MFYIFKQIQDTKNLTLYSVQSRNTLMNYKNYCYDFGLQTFDQWFQRKNQRKQLLMTSNNTRVRNVGAYRRESGNRGAQFFDYEFPNVKHDQKESRYMNGRTVTFGWKSLSKMIRGITIFKGISPNDIFQKQLNDCYFLAALSAIADTRRQIIQNLFKVQENEERKYIIQLIIGGQKQVITIDDYVPFATNRSGNYTIPLYASINKIESEIQSWVILIQKAWAKAAKGYENIEWGDLSEAFAALIGCHTQVHQVLKFGSWEIIKDGVRANLPMIVSTMKTVPNGTNIVATHAYTILGVRQFGGSKLLQLRNPFGHTEPDKSIAYHGKQQDDGIFQMELQEFQKYFDFVSIAKVIENARYSSLRIQNRIIGIVKVNAPTRGRYSVAICTQLYRSFLERNGANRNTLEQPKMIIRILARQQVSDSFSKLKINLDMKPDIYPSERVSAEWILEKGDNYILFQKQNKWPSKDFDKRILTFSVYGPGPFEAGIELIRAE